MTRYCSCFITFLSIYPFPIYPLSHLQVWNIPKMMSKYSFPPNTLICTSLTRVPYLFTVLYFFSFEIKCIIKCTNTKYHWWVFNRFSSPILSKCLSGYRTWPSPWKQPLSLSGISLLLTHQLQPFFFFFSFLKMIIWLVKTFFCYNVLLSDILSPPKDFRGGVMFFTKAKMQW